MEHSGSLGSSRLRRRCEEQRRCLGGGAHLNTTNVRPPSENPLKLSAPFTPVRPAVSWKRAERAAALKLSHVASIACRSEEHTSELQSRLHLVCRLLLEK